MDPGNENTTCKYSLDELLKKLDDYRNNGRDSFIIMAHVEQKSGFIKEYGGGRIEKLGENELFRKTVLGFQKVRSLDIIQKLKQWLNNDLPVFIEGSDCKNIDSVGKSPKQNGEDKNTYIKLGDFNFSALKFAFLDKENKIKVNKPKPQNAYIESIKFEGGKLDGEKLKFNSNMNNLIGIRGSGKSTILETIRYALDIEIPNEARDIEYKNELVENLLGSGGKIILKINDIHNNIYKIEKISNV